MRRRGRNYRGSRRGGLLIPVLVVLCIIAAGVLYFVSDNEVYTKSGEKVVVVKGKDAEKEKESDVVIEQTRGEKTESVPGTYEPDKNSRVMRGYFIDINTVKNAELFDNALLTAKGLGNINTVVLEVKAEDGTLAFASQHEFIKEKQLSGDDEVLRAAITKARENGFSAALYISCFKDNGAAHSNFKNAVIQKENGWVWRDDTNMRWLSAYAEGSHGYITEIIEKLVTFSPDEIILANVSFPATGNTGTIDYGENPPSKSDALFSFVEKVVKVAGNIPVSAVYENYSTNLAAASGQDIGVFKKGFGALYIKRDAGKNTLSFDTAKTAVADDVYRLIPIIPSFEETASGFLIKK